MGKSFKDLSFAKKTLAVFVIAFGVLLFGAVALFVCSGVSSMYDAGNMFANETVDLGANYYADEQSSYSDSYSKSVSSGSEARYSNNSNEILAKDYSAEIESRDIMGVVDDVVDVARNYHGVLNGSSAGDNGYGYVSVDIPSNEVEAFVDELRAEYNVVSYDQNARNVSDDYENIDERLDYLQSLIETYKNDIKEGSENGEDVSYLRERLEEINEEIWYLNQHRDSIDDDVDYSNVYISIVDKNYTAFHTFDGVWLAVKQGMHAFVLCIVYGLYVILYAFLMIVIVKFLYRFIKKLGNKTFNVIKPTKAESVEQLPEQSDE